MNTKRILCVFINYVRQACYLMILVLSFSIAFLCRDIVANTYEYDRLNRVTKVVFEDNSYIEYKYDANEADSEEELQTQ